MSGRLAGKTVLITGGASGIGRASALLFAGEGARVLIADINEADGTAAAEAVDAAGGVSWFYRTDVTSAESVEETFARLDSDIGPLHVLYNCAGGSTDADAAVTGLEVKTIEHVLRLELISAMLCSRAGIPRIIASGGGSVINMSSFVAFRGVFDLHAYTAAKGALVALTRSMAGSYAKDRVRVNAIAPGVALTERAAARMQAGNIAPVMPFSWEDYPFGRGRAEDIAELALFLASDASRMVNAQTILADGGLSAY
jgi:NAD(P)-dependent dehydrogenase (short-subunit alcohol dehydrogenase family)